MKKQAKISPLVMEDDHDSDQEELHMVEKVI